MNGKIRTSSGFYLDDAATVARDAARLQPAPAVPDQTPATAGLAESAAEPYVPPVLLDEPTRAPLTPRPALNQNAGLRAERPTLAKSLDTKAPRLSAVRIAAWIVFLPWYIGIAAAAFGVDFLFVKDLLGF